MILRGKVFLLVGLVLVGVGGQCFAQDDSAAGYWGGGGDGGSIVPMEGGGYMNEDTIHTAREAASHSTGTPVWSNRPGFEKDVFTFARIVFKSGTGPHRRFRLGWWVDFPDADLNFSYRLQQLTSAKTDPDGKVLKLTDPLLGDYPLIIMEHAGYINLSDEENGRLSRYLLNGGVLFFNDFWSTREWEGVEAQMKRVLPGRSWIELSTDHPLFHCVYNVEGPMNRLQVPTMQFWNRSHNPDDPNSRLSLRFRGEGSENMHVRAWLDDKQHIMALAIHNSDIPDGWEREGEDNAYFHTFSEKIAYPIGINFIFYLMTH